VTRLSLDYAGLVRDLRVPPPPADVGQVLLSAAADRYEHMCGEWSLVQFMQSGATYLFDFARAPGADQEDRTVAAWTVTPATAASATFHTSGDFRFPPIHTARWWTEDI
jgi:hypothetical protein